MRQKALSSTNVSPRHRRSSLEDIHCRHYWNNVEGQQKGMLSSNKDYLLEIPAQLRERILLAVEAEVLRRVNDQTDKHMITVRHYVEVIDEQLRDAQRTIQKLQKSHEKDFAIIMYQRAQIQSIREKYNQSKKKFAVIRDKYVHLKSQSQKGEMRQTSKASAPKTGVGLGMDGDESLSSDMTAVTTEAVSTVVSRVDSTTETTAARPRVLFAEGEGQATDLESDLAELEPEKVNATTTPHNSIRLSETLRRTRRTSSRLLSFIESLPPIPGGDDDKNAKGRHRAKPTSVNKRSFNAKVKEESEEEKEEEEEEESPLNDSIEPRQRRGRTRDERRDSGLDRLTAQRSQSLPRVVDAANNSIALDDENDSSQLQEQLYPHPLSRIHTYRLAAPPPSPPSFPPHPFSSALVRSLPNSMDARNTEFPLFSPMTARVQRLPSAYVPSTPPPSSSSSSFYLLNASSPFVATATNANVNANANANTNLTTATTECMSTKPVSLTPTVTYTDSKRILKPSSACATQQTRGQYGNVTTPETDSALPTTLPQFHHDTRSEETHRLNLNSKLNLKSQPLTLHSQKKKKKKKKKKVFVGRPKRLEIQMFARAANQLPCHPSRNVPLATHAIIQSPNSGLRPTRN